MEAVARDTDDESQIVVESEDEGEYLVYTARRLQVCISRHSNQTGTHGDQEGVNLQDALLGTDSVVWDRPSGGSDSGMSVCSACNGAGRRRRRYQQRWCKLCKVHPSNAAYPSNAAENAAVQDKLTMSNSALLLTEPSLTIFGYPVYPTHRYCLLYSLTTAHCLSLSSLI